MRVQVDGPRGDNEPLGVQHLGGAAALEVADCGDLPVLNAEVSTVPWHPRTIDNRPALDQRIELCHDVLLFVHWLRTFSPQRPNAKFQELLPGSSRGELSPCESSSPWSFPLA